MAEEKWEVGGFKRDGYLVVSQKLFAGFDPGPATDYSTNWVTDLTHIYKVRPGDAKPEAVPAAVWAEVEACFATWKKPREIVIPKQKVWRDDNEDDAYVLSLVLSNAPISNAVDEANGQTYR